MEELIGMEVKDRERKAMRTKLIAASAVMALLIAGGIAYLLLREKERPVQGYAPENALPDDFILVTDYPSSEDDLFAISTLSSLQFIDGNYHPMVVCSPEGGLSRQEMFTLSNLRTDRAKVLFTNKDTSLQAINSQLSQAGLSVIDEKNAYALDGTIASTFLGFRDILTVSTYEESLWAASYAKRTDLVLVKGPSTFETQEDAWTALRNTGIDASYIIVTNPYDSSTEALRDNVPSYDTYDDAFFCPDLSLMTAQMAAYHDAYVITNATPLSSVEWTMDMALSQNMRAAGILSAVRGLSASYGPAEYVVLVGSAPAVPQFLMPGPAEGELVNSDVMYGFLAGGTSVMDAAVGRIVQYEVSLASNQLLKTYLMDDFSDTVHVDYRDVAGGPQEKEWRTHGASFSGFEITYERMQATPGRWICTDFEEAGFTYDYVGPFGTGNKFLDGTVNSMESSLEEICKGSGYVAYRGHGSDTGSLYGIRVYGPNGEEYQLRWDEAAELDLPPQIAYFVSCLNSKIYGHGPGTDPSADVAFDKLFSLNYLSAGPAVLLGATEVSFSSIGQDLRSIPAEYLPFIDDHQWDNNDAWYAFVWDGILDHPGEYGTVGKAMQWSENRYMKYAPNNSPTPFEPSGEADWYEVTFFTCYGDPSFRPAVDPTSQPGYDPWHNGADDL